MKIRTCITLTLVAALSGCATATYKLDGQTYTSPEEFQNATDRLMRDTQSQLVRELRVPTPVSKKSLTVGIPTVETIKNGMSTTGTPSATQMDNVARMNRKEFEMIASTLSELGIYESVKSADTTGGHLQPSSANSVLYVYSDPQSKASQWYINGSKAGRQAVNVDRGEPKFIGKATSFLNSIKGYALSD